MSLEKIKSICTKKEERKECGHALPPPEEAPGTTKSLLGQICGVQGGRGWEKGRKREGVRKKGVVKKLEGLVTHTHTLTAGATSVQMKMMCMANWLPMRAHMLPSESSGEFLESGLFCWEGSPQLEAIMAT